MQITGKLIIAMKPMVTSARSHMVPMLEPAPMKIQYASQNAVAQGKGFTGNMLQNISKSIIYIIQIAQQSSEGKQYHRYSDKQLSIIAHACCQSCLYIRRTCKLFGRLDAGLRHMKAVAVQISRVSINTDSICTGTLLNRVKADRALTAFGAEPTPASLLYRPRLIPNIMQLPAKPPKIAVKSNASAKILPTTPGTRLICIIVRINATEM